MREYHKIYYYNKGIIGAPVIAFDKLDGSNIRVEWSKKRGFYKYGTRTQMLDKSHQQLGNAVSIFEEKYFEPLNTYFSTNKDYRALQSITIFLEYFGPNSFAGYHEPTDKMDVVLLDVWQHSKGWVEPKEFVNQFSGFGIPDIIYRGNLNNEFIQDIKDDKYNLKEGVVVKGLQDTKRVDKKVWMVKVKANHWYERVKERYGQNAIIEDLNGDLSILN